MPGVPSIFNRAQLSQAGSGESPGVVRGGIPRSQEPRGPAPAPPVAPYEGRKVAARQPDAVATGQQPQNGDLVQQLAQEAERHVEVHGEQA